MMKHLLLSVLAVVVLALAISGAAHARAPLSQNTPINDQLFAAAVGDAIRKACPTISARMGLVMRKARALETYALAQGYSGDEIDAYINSKPDQEKMKRRRDAYLLENGAVVGDRESYCRVGRAEIAAKSPIGVLLRSR